MCYPYIRGGDLTDYDKKAPWDFLHAYIDAHIQILIYDYPGDGVQAISRLKSQFENMRFAEQIRSNRLFQRLIHTGGDSAINYIKRFHNDKALEVSVVNSYSEDQFMPPLLYHFLQGGKYSAHISIHQAEFNREGKFVDIK